MAQAIARWRIAERTSVKRLPLKNDDDKKIAPVTQVPASRSGFTRTDSRLRISEPWTSRGGSISGTKKGGHNWTMAAPGKKLSTTRTAFFITPGGGAAGLKAPVLKTGRDESPSWVRIPPPPFLSLRSREICAYVSDLPACTESSEPEVL